MVDAKDGEGEMPFEERNINGYILHEEIGSGGMSRVFRATREGTNETFALKSIRIENMAADFERRLRREPEVQQGIGHENIVNLVDWFRVRDEFFLVMELVDGRSMSQLIYRESGPMPFERARGYMRQMLRAVHHLHTLGIIHRDIKPSNVLVRTDDVIKLADFGIAKFAWQQGETKTQKGLGTPEYMSPEQARGTHIDHRSDIYSLGITFFEMLTARKPFARGEETPAAYVDVIQSILSKPLPDPRTFQPSIPAGAVRLLNKATAKDPSERFQSATEFLGELELIDANDFSPATVAIGDLPKAAAAPVADRRSAQQAARPVNRHDDERPRRSRAGLWITLLLLLVAVGGYFGYSQYQKAQQTDGGTIDSTDARNVLEQVAADYRTYSIDHNAGGLASLFASSGNRYFSLKSARRSQIQNDAEKFFNDIDVTTIYDIQVRKPRATADSIIDGEWLITYERTKKDGAILRGQTLDEVRLRLIDGEWLMTRQESEWVKRRNEPPPPEDEPEVIDIPTPVDTTDRNDDPEDTPPVDPPKDPPVDTANPSEDRPPIQFPPDQRPPRLGTPPINPNPNGTGTPSSPRRPQQ